MFKNLFANRYFLFVIIIIAAFLRLYNIAELPPGLYPDEAMNGNNALEALSSGNFKVFYPENNGREGLFINIQALFLKFLTPLFGNNPEPWILRLPSAIFGILTVLGVYLFAKELFNIRTSDVLKINDNNLGTSDVQENPKSEILNPKQIQNSNVQNLKRFRISNLEFRISHGEKIALLSSFFLAVSFWHINFSRIGFRAIMAPFFLTWGLYFLMTSLNKITSIDDIQEKFKIQKSKIKNTIQNSKVIIFSLLGGLFYGLGFHSYIAYRATPILILIILFLYWIKNKEPQVRKKILLSTFYFLFSAIIVFAPLGIYFIEHPQDFFGRTTQISVFSSPTPFKDLGMNILKTAGMFNFVGDFNWRHNYAGRPQLFWPVGIMFVVGIILGIRQLLKFQITSAKLQTNSNNQTANIQNMSDLKFRILNLFEICNLRFGVLFLWFIVAALPVVISNEGMPHALRAILMVPPAFILAGFGGVWLYEKVSSIPEAEPRRKANSQRGRQVRYGAGKYQVSGAKIKKTLTQVCFFVILLLLVVESYFSYFIVWGRNLHTAGAFAADYARLGRELRDLPKELPKYVIVEAGGVDARGLPMSTQTVMFITDTFTPKKQKEKNIHYILPNEINKIPVGGYTKTIN